MEIQFTENIHKTQNSVQDRPIIGDYFYSLRSFINKNIIIKYSFDELCNAVMRKSEKSLNDIIGAKIYAMQKELKPKGSHCYPAFLNITILSKEINNEGLKIKATITKCEADC